jgi:predicted phage terminase large subunit-like protein
MFQRGWFEVVPEGPKGARQVRFWDLAATEKAKGKDPDWSVGALVALLDGKWYIQDVRRVRATPGKVEAMVKMTAAEDGDHTIIRMEQEPGSSGITVIDHYKRKVLVGYDFMGVKSTGDKLERARPFASAAESGNVKVVSAPWNGVLIDELESVPFGSHDDQMDAISGAMSVLKPVIGYADFQAMPADTSSVVASGLSRAEYERLGPAPLSETY